MAFLKVLQFGRGGRKDERNQPEFGVDTVSPTPGKPIQYDTELVPTLKSDHNRIIHLYGSIGLKLNNRKFYELQDELLVFKTHLQGHLLVENVRFYNYLEQKLADDPLNYELMRDFRREMNHIAQAVVNYVKKYRSCRFTDSVVEEFTKEYQKVGQLLQERVNREESGLYVLYTP